MTRRKNKDIDASDMPMKQVLRLYRVGKEFVYQAPDGNGFQHYDVGEEIELTHWGEALIQRATDMGYIVPIELDAVEMEAPTEVNGVDLSIGEWTWDRPSDVMPQSM